MSQNHVLVRFIDELRSYLRTESSEGRIVPAVRAIEEFIDWNNHTTFPAVRLWIEGRMNTDPKDGYQYGAKLNIGAAVTEPDAKKVQRAVWSFEQDIITAIRRKDGYFPPGVHLTYRGTAYKGKARSGKAPVALAEIQYAAVYRETLAT